MVGPGGVPDPATAWLCRGPTPRQPRRDAEAVAGYHDHRARARSYRITYRDAPLDHPPIGTTTILVREVEGDFGGRPANSMNYPVRGPSVCEAGIPAEGILLPWGISFQAPELAPLSVDGGLRPGRTDGGRRRIGYPHVDPLRIADERGSPATNAHNLVNWEIRGDFVCGLLSFSTISMPDSAYLLVFFGRSSVS